MRYESVLCPRFCIVPLTFSLTFYLSFSVCCSHSFANIAKPKSSYHRFAGITFCMWVCRFFSAILNSNKNSNSFSETRKVEPMKNDKNIEEEKVCVWCSSSSKPLEHVYILPLFPIFTLCLNWTIVFFPEAWNSNIDVDVVGVCYSSDALFSAAQSLCSYLKRDTEEQKQHQKKYRHTTRRSRKRSSRMFNVLCIHSLWHLAGTLSFACVLLFTIIAIIASSSLRFFSLCFIFFRIIIWMATNTIKATLIFSVNIFGGGNKKIFLLVF